MRAFLIGLLIVGCIVAVALLVDFNPHDTKTSSTKTATTTSTTSSKAAAAQNKQRAGSAGAAVEEGPGSASLTGAPGAAGVTDSSAVSTAGLFVRPFASGSPWNTTITGESVDSNSSTMVRKAEQRVGVVEVANAPPKTTTVTDRSGLFVNTIRWTSPIFSTQNGVQTKVVCRQLPPYCGDGRNLVSLSIPADATPDPRYDGYITVEDPQTKIAYSMWRARRGDGNVMSYQFLRTFALDGPGFQVPNSVSTIGSGLPSFAGYIHPEEIKAGRIDHALAIAIPGPATRKYVQPASATDGIGATDSIPEGARIRLKAGVKAPKLLGQTNVIAQRAIMTALRTYGAIVVERAKAPTLYAKRNYDWTQPLRAADGRYLSPRGRPLSKFLNHARFGTPLLRGNEVQGLTLDDFEVMTLGPIFTFPALASTEVANSSSSTKLKSSQTGGATP